MKLFPGRNRSIRFLIKTFLITVLLLAVSAISTYQGRPALASASNIQDTHRPMQSVQPAYAQKSKQPAISYTVHKGDSIYSILKNNDVDHDEIIAIVKASKRVFDLHKKIRPGHNFILTYDQTEQNLIQLKYEITDTQTLEIKIENNRIYAKKTQQKLVIDDSSAAIVEKNQPINKPSEYSTKTRVEVPGKDNADNEVQVRFERAEGTINNSLYEAAVSEGVSPQIISGLTDIFAWDVNFFTDIKTGDRFSILYEKYFINDKFKGYGRILAARFIIDGEEHTAIHYYNKKRNIEGYYDISGRPIKKLFLKAPVKFRRISSTFSYRRIHPIFHVPKPHLGVDYAAPKGTPVNTIADGRVTFAGWKRGFGKTITITHQQGYKSYYGHLSRIARSIRPGKKIEQGDVIGYVGSTGYSTGPHLDFRVSAGSKFVNPLKLKAITPLPLSGRDLASFKSITSKCFSMMKSSLSRDMALIRKTDIIGG